MARARNRLQVDSYVSRSKVHVTSTTTSSGVHAGEHLAPRRRIDETRIQLENF